MIYSPRRSLHGEVLGYQSPYPGPTPALLVRTTDGTMSAAWETEAVPADLGDAGATFAFMLGLASGHGAHRFDLSVDGKPWFSFRSAKDTSEQEWTVAGEGGAELSFRTTLVGHFKEMFGFMFLTLPRCELTPGVPVRLEVVGEAAGSQDYLMAFEKPPEPWIEIRPEEALVRAEAGTARLVRVDVSHIAPPAAACTGMRKGEILGVPLNALHLDKGFLVVLQPLYFTREQGIVLQQPKTKKSRRMIILPDFVKRAREIHLVKRKNLSQSPRWKESGLVFSTDIGTLINPHNLLQHFKAKTAEAGLPRIKFHSLRHSVASILLENNTHPKLVAELLGHSSENLIRQSILSHHQPDEYCCCCYSE